MSRALVCDACGEVVEVDSHGESNNGETSAWVRVGTLDGRVYGDACTRACALKLLDDDSWLTDKINARYEGVMAVVRALQEAEETGPSPTDGEPDA